jgi:hypothetical protein
MNLFKSAEAAALASTLVLTGCTDVKEEPVVYSESVMCDSITIIRVGELAFEATAEYTVASNTGEVIAQEMLNWGTPSEDATQAHRNDEIGDPFTYDYSGYAADDVPTKFTVTAFATTVDSAGTVRFVESGENCTYDLKIVK